VELVPLTKNIFLQDLCQFWTVFEVTLNRYGDGWGYADDTKASTSHAIPDHRQLCNELWLKE